MSHRLFVNDVLLFPNGTIEERRKCQNILTLYSKEIGMTINEQKSTVSYNDLVEDVTHSL